MKTNVDTCLKDYVTEYSYVDSSQAALDYHCDRVGIRTYQEAPFGSPPHNDN